MIGLNKFHHSGPVRTDFFTQADFAPILRSISYTPGLSAQDHSMSSHFSDNIFIVKVVSCEGGEGLLWFVSITRTGDMLRPVMRAFASKQNALKSGEVFCRIRPRVVDDVFGFEILLLLPFPSTLGYIMYPDVRLQALSFVCGKSQHVDPGLVGVDPRIEKKPPNSSCSVMYRGVLGLALSSVNPMCNSDAFWN